MKKLVSCLVFIFPFLNLFSAQTDVPTNLFKLILPENPIIIEAGAQFGEDTDKMSQMWPKGVVYAFEPSPSSYQSLLKCSLNRHNIIPFQLAISNQKGKTSFYLSGGRVPF